MMHVPTPDEEGVTSRNLTAREITAERVAFTPAGPDAPVAPQPIPQPTPQPAGPGNGSSQDGSQIPAGGPPASKPKNGQIPSDRTINGYDTHPQASSGSEMIAAGEPPLPAKPTLSERLAESALYQQMSQEAALPELEVTVGRLG
jgi:hypothetical protein